MVQEIAALIETRGLTASSFAILSRTERAAPSDDRKLRRRRMALRFLRRTNRSSTAARSATCSGGSQSASHSPTNKISLLQ